MSNYTPRTAPVDTRSQDEQDEMNALGGSEWPPAIAARKRIAARRAAQ